MICLQADGNIVVVGGGSIGLCTAYNLARRTFDGSPNVNIKVIEAFETPFTAASGTCTGGFHYALEPRTQSLGKYSFDLWAAEAAKPDFQQATGYRSQSSFGLDPGNGEGLDKLPDWMKKESSWDIDTEVLGSATATVNPIGLGKWLSSQCLALGVEILTGWQIAKVTLSAENKVDAVTCQKGDHAKLRIGCKQLLFACGPWTPAIYQELFPSSAISLLGSTDAGDWILCKNPCPTRDVSTAFVSAANLVGEKLEFAGRNDGSIWGCGRRNSTASLPLPGQLDKPDDKLIEELSLYARNFLNTGCNCVENHAGKFQLGAKGRAFRPATKSGLPVISAVSSSDLTGSSADQLRDEDLSSGVFICWGHGSYGLTLGMGSGRLMSQLMLGEQPDIDISMFTLKHDSIFPSSTTITDDGKESRL